MLIDTADFYRFFDATTHAEFLYACVKQTVEQDLPRETEFLKRYDQFRVCVQAIIDMPDSTIDRMFRFLQQDVGHLSKRAREQEFGKLSDAEVSAAEAAYAESFLGEA